MEEILSINGFSKDSGKFIQVKGNEKTYLWSGKSKMNHGQILKNLLDSEKIPYKNFNKDYCDCLDRVSVSELPESKNEHYEIFGAGEFLRQNGIVKFYGESGIYQVGPNKDHLESLSKKIGLEFIIEE